MQNYNIGAKIRNLIQNKGVIDSELDCEYYDAWNDRENRETLTTQFKIHDVGCEGQIFTHGKNKLEGCPHRKTGNIIIDYLEDYNVIDGRRILEKNEKNKLFKYGFTPFKDKYKKLMINVYSFFGIVDFARGFYGGSGKFIDNVIRNKHPNLSLIQNKRLETKWEFGNNGSFDYIPTPWVIKIDDEVYIIFLRSMDIAGMRGNDSYANYALASGIKLEEKGLMDDYKSDMREAIKNHPEDFKKYSLGDLKCREIYRAFQKQVDKVCESLGIPYIEISLTVGSTVNKIMNEYHKQYHSFEMKEKLFEELNWHLSTPKYLMEQKSRTSQFLAKTDGGRCHNNKPFIANTKGETVDIDIVGCYANTMASLESPFGEPMIWDHKKSTVNGEIDSREKSVKTIGEFMRDENLGGELVDGLWVARISTRKGYELKHPQDLIPSWIAPKKIEDWKTGCEFDGENDFITNEGDLKIFTNEIHHGLLNSDIWEVVKNYYSPQALKEFENNVIVESAIFYPKSSRVSTPDEYRESINNELGETTTEINKQNGKFGKTIDERHNYVWFSVSLEKPIDLLTSERKKYDKKDPNQLPQNKTFKLITNTIYGVSVSSKFPQSNVVLANNITARARTMAYCMEKGLNMFQTITDGGMFNPKKVITNGERNITVQNLVSIKNVKTTKLKYTEIKGETKEELEKNSLKHLSQLFSRLSIFQQQVFELEIKTNNKDEYIANGASFHGAANYLLNYPSEPNAKMRGYSDKKLVNHDNNDFPVVNNFMMGILNNPKKLNRTLPRLEVSILKTKEYARNPEKYRQQGIKYGCSIVKTKQVLEFVLNQFTFQTLGQRKSWEKVIQKLQRKNNELNYGQSLEMFYTNSDGTLDFERMINEVYEDISSGKLKPRCMDSKSRHTHRKYKKHPHLIKREEYRKIENPILK